MTLTVEEQKQFAEGAYVTKINEGIEFHGQTIYANETMFPILAIISHLSHGLPPTKELAFHLYNFQRDPIVAENSEYIELVRDLFAFHQKCIFALVDVWGQITTTGFADQAAVEAAYATAYTNADPALPVIPTIGSIITALEESIEELESAPPAHTHTSTDITNFNTAVGALIDAAINNLINGAPGTLDTLGEIADRLANDSDAVAAIVSSLNDKVDKITGKGLSQNDYSNAEKAKVGKAVVGTSVKNSAFPIFKSATVSDGNLVVHLTDDGLSTGNALFPNGNVYLDSLNYTTQDSSVVLAPGVPVLSNSNKTITIPMNRSSSTGILTLLGIAVLSVPAAANGSVVKLTVWGD